MRHCFKEMKIYPDTDIYILDIGSCRYRAASPYSQYFISTQTINVLIHLWPVLDAVGEGNSVLLNDFCWYMFKKLELRCLLWSVLFS